MNRIAALTLLFLPVFALAQNETAAPAPSKYKRMDVEIGTDFRGAGNGLHVGGSHFALSLKMFLDYSIVLEQKVSIIPAHGVFVLRNEGRKVRLQSTGTCSDNVEGFSCVMHVGETAIRLEMPAKKQAWAAMYDEGGFTTHQHKIKVLN